MALVAQARLLQEKCRRQDELVECLTTDHERQPDLMEEQNALLRSMRRDYEQRLEEAAVESFRLDHEYIELRQRLRELEAQLAATAGAAPPEPVPF